MDKNEAAREPLALNRVALLVEYDGLAFQGLQRQRHTEETVQGKIEKAAGRVGSHDVGFVAAGRTDAGVHSTGQVVTVNLPQRLEIHRVHLAMNALLPPEIRVRRAAIAPQGFSPRFDARQRTYVYRMMARRPVAPIMRRFVAQTAYELDREAVLAAAESFRGQWEFREWRSSMCEATRTFLNIDEARAIPPNPSPQNDEEPTLYWRFLFRARSFLHHQVRFMVGGIVAVGSGRLHLEDLHQALSEGRRPKRVKCEAACGLCLSDVKYPADKDPFDQATEFAREDAT